MSQLMGIIQRLNAMQEDEAAEPQSRRFEKDGTPVCEVKYFHASGSFEVEIYGVNSKYQFDDIDMTAIEIFEALQEN
ncbi:YkuJ family protein [Listeria ilorinensis]|uniref:YkuJ family protein n=1 Tax=Listeria ilorinensis TaxID=2867439 RepID=UPI001EF6A673|nr:YkuJ family protein [Listeria ilorinensis]